MEREEPSPLLHNLVERLDDLPTEEVLVQVKLRKDLVARHLALELNHLEPAHAVGEHGVN